MGPFPFCDGPDPAIPPRAIPGRLEGTGTIPDSPCMRLLFGEMKAWLDGPAVHPCLRFKLEDPSYADRLTGKQGEGKPPVKAVIDWMG